MPVYLVERALPGVTLAQVTAIRRAAWETCAAFTAQGQLVRYVRGTFLPGESRCLCLFEAPDAERVRAVNEAAQIPYNRIITALNLETERIQDGSTRERRIVARSAPPVHRRNAAPAENEEPQHPTRRKAWNRASRH